MPEVLCVSRETWQPFHSPWGISVMPSSPAPHTYNLIATTKASLGEAHPIPTTPGAACGSDWVRESTAMSQRPCLILQGAL